MSFEFFVPHDHKFYKWHVLLSCMVKEIIGGRPVDITHEGSEIKIVFHPIAKGAKHPDASVFSIKLTKKDLETIKKAF